MDIPKAKPTRDLFGLRNLLVVGSVISLFGLTFALSGLGDASPSIQQDAVWIDIVERGDLVREIRASGTLVPRETRWITAAGAATVQELMVQPGARVEADTVIMRLSNPTALANLQKAKAVRAGADAEVAAQQSALASQLLDHQAALAKAESSYRISKIKAQAQAQAHAAGVASRLEAMQSEITAEQEGALVEIERQRVTTFKRNFEAQMDAVKAKRNEASSLLEVAQREADALIVRAGIAGVVQQINVEPGQQVQAATNLARVARPDVLIARLQVPEVSAKDLKAGLVVAVELNATTIYGRIQRIDPSVRNGRVVVDVAFDKSLPTGARPDLSVDGRIALGTLRGIVSIRRPAQATQDGMGSLFVLTPSSGIYMRRQVRFGATSSDRIEVRSGLSPGDKVILSDMSQWQDYDTLQVE